MMQVGINSGNGWSILALSLVGSQLRLILPIQAKTVLNAVKWSRSHYPLGLTSVNVAVN